MKVVLILILISFLAPVHAQTDLDIVYDRSSDAEMPQNGRAFNDSLSAALYLKGLVDSLHDQAFLEASVDSVVYRPGGARAYLHIGRRYSFVKVSLGQVDQQALRSLNIRASGLERHPLEISDFRKLQTRLLEHYENTGYPFASATLNGLEINGDTIQGSLAIEKNRHYRIDSIHIYGNEAVSRRHLYRHIGIRPGDPYSEYRFIRAGEILRETPFLTEIREPEMEFMQESADLYLYLDPGQSSRFNGILGILPGDGSTGTKLAGEINLDLVNAFKRTEIIGFHWQSPGNQVQQIDVNFEQPWLMGQPFGADLHLHMYRQDTTYLTVLAEAGILFSSAGSSRIRVFGKTHGTSLIAGEEPAGAVEGLPVAADVSGYLFGMSYRNGRIINNLNPYRGWEVNASAGAGNKRVILPPGYGTNEKERKTGFGEGTAAIRWFVPVTTSTTLMLASISGIRLNPGAEKEEDYFFANELFLVGGLHTLRGFDERSLAASAYAVQRIEYRYLFDESGNIFLFFDGMTYRQKLKNSIKSDTPFGFGGGLTFGTRAGQFSISYALGRQLGNPLSFRSAKVHIGIINRF